MAPSPKCTGERLDVQRALVPLSEARYEDTRAKDLEAFMALKRTRRVALGENISLLFENRATVLALLHETLRANRSWQEPRLSEDIAEHQHLIPQSGVLSATFMLHGGDLAEGVQLCEALATQTGITCQLHIGDRAISAEPITQLGSMASPVQYLRFAVGNQASTAMASPLVPVALSIRAFGATTSYPIAWQTRLSLSTQLGQYGTAQEPPRCESTTCAQPERGLPRRLLTAIRISRRVPHVHRAGADQFG